MGYWLLALFVITLIYINYIPCIYTCVNLLSIISFHYVYRGKLHLSFYTARWWTDKFKISVGNKTISEDQDLDYSSLLRPSENTVSRLQHLKVFQRYLKTVVSKQLLLSCPLAFRYSNPFQNGSTTKKIFLPKIFATFNWLLRQRPLKDCQNGAGFVKPLHSSTKPELLVKIQ